MTKTFLIPALVVLLALLGLVIWQLYRHLHVRPRRQYQPGTWQSMESASIPFRYFSTRPVNEMMLAAAVNRAYWCLVNFGPWRGTKLWSALANVHIWVVEPRAIPPTVCSPREAQFTLTGPLTRADIRVGSSFDTLCHELAHLAEARVDTRVDREHRTWGPRGIARALDAYANSSINPI